MAVIVKRNTIGSSYTPFEPDQPEYYRITPHYGDFIRGIGLNVPAYDHITSATQVKKTTGRIPDIITVRTIRVCSQRFRDFVEEWEPGLHFFVPFTLKRKNGENLGPHYKYGIGQDIDCLLTEELQQHFNGFDTADGGRKYEFFVGQATGKAGYREQYPDESSAPEIRISKPAISGAHLWTMGLLGLGDCDEPMVMSDAMYKAFKKEKFRELEYQCLAHEVDKPWTAEENMGPKLDAWREREKQIAIHWPKHPARRGPCA
ncbi:MAG: DUF1629 domain-containing protein [Sphingomonas sp.]